MDVLIATTRDFELPNRFVGMRFAFFKTVISSSLSTIPAIVLSLVLNCFLLG